MNRAILPAAAVLAVTCGALAQSGPISLSFDEPVLDRWMYPFSGTPGTRVNASTFGALGIDGFDDRDAQFIVGFDTAGDIPAGQGAGAYRVVSARVTAVIDNNLQFVYDDTQDPVESFFDTADPEYVEDATPGRPLEIYATGYRSGFTILSWQETTFFGGPPVIPPAQGNRTAYAALYNDVDDVVDLSNNVAERTEVTPLAIGQTDGVAAGELVPAETVFTFDINTCATGASAFFDASFDAGRVNLTITSLHSALMGSTEFPSFFTKENAISPILGYAPQLEITVIAVGDADLTGDGSLDLFDFLAFQNAFDAGEPLADFDGNCRLDIFDFLEFQNAFDGG